MGTWKNFIKSKLRNRYNIYIYIGIIFGYFCQTFVNTILKSETFFTLPNVDNITPKLIADYNDHKLLCNEYTWWI